MVNHSSFVLTRNVRASVASAFKAWSDVNLKSQWFVGPEGRWTLLERTFDFQVGGKETCKGGFEQGGTSYFDSTYMDIVPDNRIVYSYRMSVDDELISVSLCTVEFLPNEAGCEVKFTEQAAYFQGQYGHDSRFTGSNMLLDQMAAVMEATK